MLKQQRGGIITALIKAEGRLRENEMREPYLRAESKRQETVNRK